MGVYLKVVIGFIFLLNSVERGLSNVQNLSIGLSLSPTLLVSEQVSSAVREDGGILSLVGYYGLFWEI